MRWIGGVCALFFSGLMLAGAGAQETSAARTEAAVTQAIAGLDHADWSVREQSTQKLIQIGPAAMKALARCAATGSPEAALRALEVLAAFYDRNDLSDIEALESELEQLQSAKGSLGEEAHRVWEQHWPARERRALAKFEEFGGRIDYAADQRIDVDDQFLPTIDHLVIGHKWNGGDEGVKQILRLTHGWKSESAKRIYRVKDAALTEAAVQKLEDAGIHVEERGAYLGISSMVPFAGLDDGCRINEVRPHSPAAKGGLLQDDIILQVDDKPVKQFNDLIELLKAAEPGQKATFTINRGGEEIKLPVELGDWTP